MIDNPSDPSPEQAHEDARELAEAMIRSIMQRLSVGRGIAEAACNYAVRRHFPEQHAPGDEESLQRWQERLDAAMEGYAIGRRDGEASRQERRAAERAGNVIDISARRAETIPNDLDAVRGEDHPLLAVETWPADRSCE